MGPLPRNDVWKWFSGVHGVLQDAEDGGAGIHFLAESCSFTPCFPRIQSDDSSPLWRAVLRGRFQKSFPNLFLPTCSVFSIKSSSFLACGWRFPASNVDARFSSTRYFCHKLWKELKVCLKQLSSPNFKLQASQRNCIDYCFFLQHVSQSGPREPRGPAQGSEHRVVAQDQSSEVPGGWGRRLSTWPEQVEEGEGRAAEVQSRACRWCHEVQTGELVGVWGESIPGRTVRPVLGFRGLLTWWAQRPRQGWWLLPGTRPSTWVRRPETQVEWSVWCRGKNKPAQSWGCSSFQGEERERTALPWSVTRLHSVLNSSFLIWSETLILGIRITPTRFKYKNKTHK